MSDLVPAASFEANFLAQLDELFPDDILSENDKLSPEEVSELFSMAEETRPGMPSGTSEVRGAKFHFLG